MTALTSDHVMTGAFHSLANAVRFIEDATVLYESRRCSSSYLSAVAAREELGKFNILWRSVIEIDGGSAMKTKDLRDRLYPKNESHIAKLSAGQSIFTTQGPLPVETFCERQHRFSEMRKIDSHSTHSQRLSEQYVDLLSDGSWSIPGRTSAREALNFIHAVACEVAGALHSGEDDERFRFSLRCSRVTLPLSMDLQNRVLALPIFEGS